MQVIKSTPYEKFYGKKPDLSHLRVFGCKVYAKVPDKKRKKLDDKAQLGTYLGPIPDGKGCLVLIKNAQGRSFIRPVRDVITVEDLSQPVGVPVLQNSEHTAHLENEHTAQLLREPADSHDGLTRHTMAQENTMGVEAHVPVLNPVGSAMPYGQGNAPGSNTTGGAMPYVQGNASGNAIRASQIPNPTTLPSLTAPSGLPGAPQDLASGSQAGRSTSADAVMRVRPVTTLPHEGGLDPSCVAGSGPRSGSRSGLPGAPPEAVQAATNVIRSRQQSGYGSGPSTSGDGSGPSTLTERPVRARREPDRFMNNPEYMHAKVAQSGSHDIPRNYWEAMNHPQKEKWGRSIGKEYCSLLANDVFEYVLREGWMKVLKSFWVLTVKYDADGLEDTLKARLVAGGHQQVYGVDHGDTFAPVTRNVTFRCFLAIVASRNMKVKQLDVTTAFLHGEIDCDVYMEQPDGFVQGGRDTVIKLKKCLYGLKQAPRAWHKKLTDHLKSLGLAPTVVEPCLYVKSYGDGTHTYMLMVVDDILIASNHVSQTDAVIESILSVFPGKSGDAHFYTGVKLTWGDGYVILSQTAHIDSLLEKYGMTDCTPVSLPMQFGSKMVATGQPLDLSKYHYASLVGALLYLAVTSRPDIAMTVAKLSRYMSSPTVKHWGFARQVLRYLKGTRRWGLKLGGESSVIGYCDSDYGSCRDTYRSTTGYFFVVNGGCVSWQSKLQKTVASSSTEAEIHAAAAATKEAMWLRLLLKEFGVKATPMKILCDNQGAIRNMENPIISARTKHVGIRFAFVRDRVEAGEIAFEYVSTHENAADMLTKPLNGPKHHKFCEMIGMVDMDKLEAAK